MGTQNKPKAMVAMVNGDTYPITPNEATELSKAMENKDATWSFTYNRDGSVVTLHISQISSVMVWEQTNGDR